MNANTASMIRSTRVFAAALGCVLALAACSPSNPAADPTAPAVSAQAAAATRELELYRTLLEQHNDAVAAPIGAEIVARYPGSDAATEVQKSLAEVTSRGAATTNKRRLQALWIYQSGKESGGEQNTASIYTGDAVAADRVRLVLRRHSAWGQSVYLYGSGKGFSCAGKCSISTRFDDKPEQHLKAYLPETGEPAIFISDDKAFIEKMRNAQKVTFDVVEKGHAKRTLVFETGGFDAARFPAVKGK